ALDALKAGRVHGAVVHGPPRSLPAAPPSVLRWHFARWQVGLGTAMRSRAATVESLLGGSTPVAQREPGAASQQALDRARRRAGISQTPRGPVATGHLDAARTAATLSCAGLTTEGAARAFGLRFLALEEHAVELWIDRRWAEHPGVHAVGELIRGRGFQQRIDRLGGYDLTGCGDAVAGV
ncbi:MAG: substrate-binding domain-containing protein, partial [Solirubrobacteraceae bacterium]